jgi:hypothetical protein
MQPQGSEIAPGQLCPISAGPTFATVSCTYTLLTSADVRITGCNIVYSKPKTPLLSPHNL